MNFKMFKRLVRWFGFLIVMHLVATLAFNPWVASYVSNTYQKLPMRAIFTVFVFDCILNVASMMIYLKIQSSDSEFKRRYRDAIKESGFSLLTHYKENYLKENLLRVAIFSVFHIPYAIYYGAMSHIVRHTMPFRDYFAAFLKVPISFDQFYILDAGSYVLANSPFLGFVLNSLVFAVLFFTVSIAQMVLLKKDIEKNMIF